MTTDTTSGDEIEAALENKIKVEAAEEQKPKKRVQEGIQSSDEENAEEPAQQSFMQGAAEVQQQQIAQAQEIDDANITSFSQHRDQSTLYENERDQDSKEFSHGYSAQHIEEFAAKIETKIDSKVEKEAEGTFDDLEDTDFLGTDMSLKQDLESLDEQLGDFESLNIFGVSLDS